MVNTAIQWTDNTVNFWSGCKKVSAGCKNCYMYRMKDEWKQDGAKVTRVSDGKFYEPLYWKDQRMIFACSMSDFFIPEADEWREDAWDVIRKTKQHQWQILTKRPERILECLPPDWGDGWDNVWLGVSVENMDYWGRVGMLAKVPAKVKFISAEPLLGPLDIQQCIDGERVIDCIDWIIVGGESGNDSGKHSYRPSELSWYEDIIRVAKGKTNVLVFMKQLGTHLYHKMNLKDRHGGDWENWSEHLRVREFPQREIEFDMR